jgi:23S rRNA (guanosine2251-2'-O)-methyltransferase
MNNSDFIYGIRATQEALESSQEIERILLLADDKNELHKSIARRAKELKIPVAHVPRDKFNRITKKNHQGVITFISAIKYGSLDHILHTVFAEGREPRLIILDRVTDVRNFGSIARTAEGAGFSGIIVPSKGGARINADAMKTSAGALNYLPVCRVSSLANTIKNLKDHGLRIIGCSEKSSDEFYNLDLTGPLALVLGSEELGISENLLYLCDQRGKLPMNGKIGSLNVAVATAICTYEVIRQNRS